MHAYENLDGLDLMGAAPLPATAQQKQVADRAKATGANAVTAANKLAKLKLKRPRAGVARTVSKLKAAGTALQKLAAPIASAPTKAKAVAKAAPKPAAKPVAKPATKVAPTPSRVTPAAPAAPNRAPMRAPVLQKNVRRAAHVGAQPIPSSNLSPPANYPTGGGAGGGIQAAIDQLIANIQAYTGALDQFTQLGGVYTALVVATDPSSPTAVTDPTQVAAANAILDQMDAACTSFATDPGNSSDVQASVQAMSGAAGLMQQGNAWLQSSTGKTVISTVQNSDGSTDTTYSDGSVTHVDANGNPTSSPPGTVPAGTVPPGAPAGTPPAGAPGAGTPGATGLKPSITGLSSTSVQQGDIITVSGTNFAGVTKVDVGGVQAEFSIDAPTQLSVMVPMNAPSGVLHVTSPGGTATSMLQVAQSAVAQSDPYGGNGGGGFGGGGGGGDSGGYGGDQGYGAQSQQQYASDEPSPYDQGGYADDGGQDDGPLSNDDLSTAADDAIDQLLTESGGYDDLDETAEDDGGGLDDMGIDSIGAQGSDWDNSKDYDTGSIVWYVGKFWRAVRPVKSPFLSVFQSGEVPGESDAWREDKTVTAATLIGATYDLGAAQKQMDSLKNVPVGVARIFVQRGMDAINQALANAQQPWYRADLPGETVRKEVQGHVQWHQNNLAKFSDATAIYPDGPDLKLWVLRAFVEENASEEGANQSVAGKAWSDYADMWIAAGQFIASLPPAALELIKGEAIAIRKAAASAASGFIGDVTGLPIWAWALISVGVIGVFGFVAWSILNSKAGAAAVGVVASRYIPGR